VGFGTSLFLIAVGAIMDFAVKVKTNGFNVNKIGLILMIVGAIGLVLSLFFWSSWGGFGSSRRTTRVRTGTTPDGYGSRVVAPQDTEYVETERRY
jgi:hypothetical protein